MNKIRELLENLKSQFYILVAKIEESPQFEKVLLYYEALDPRYQKRIQSGSILAFTLLIVILFCAPIYSVFSAKSTNRNYYELIADMQNFNTANNVVFQSAPRPQGWTPLPTGTLDDLDSSITQFLANNGVPPVLVETTKSTQGITIKIEQISIRQLVYFVFQLDGWYPALKFQSLKIVANKDNPSLLELSATLDFNAEEAGKLNQTLGDTNSGMQNSANASSLKSPNSSGSSANGGSDMDYPAPPPPPMGGDDFGADLPPPPPFEEDL